MSTENIFFKQTLLLLSSLLIVSVTTFARPLADDAVEIRQEHRLRAADLVSRMTLEEKIDYIAGIRSFYIRGIERLGIPEIRMADGPQGVRNDTQSTMYPSGILTASTWNRNLVYDMGRSLGRDAKARGVSVMLGPGVNIYRAPMCGRNYEYFGEDPYLVSGTGGGTAVAEVLSGMVNPSGRLPISIESRWEDSPVHDSYYDVRKRVTYSEGIFTGYRGYDRNGVKPLYPFGYGLSYTTFCYSDLRLEKLSDESVKVVFNLTNTGRKDSADVAQVYVRDVESSVVRPLKELKGYEKVWLKAGETVTVEVVLDAEAFAFYDIHSKKFVIEPGDFEILVGGSSADMKLKETITL